MQAYFGKAKKCYNETQNDDVTIGLSPANESSIAAACSGINENYSGRTEDTKVDEEIAPSQSCQVNSMLKCQGFNPKISFMHKHFSLHLLKEMNIVVEGDFFHHFSCLENSYQISKDSDTSET